MPMDHGQTHAIREALNQEFVLGREDFKDKIERILGKTRRDGAIFPHDHVAPPLCTPSTRRSLRLVMEKNDLCRSDRVIVNTPWAKLR